MKIENIGSKIIGIGEVTVLPGETKDIPKAYETSPILEVYKQCGAARIIGTPVVSRNVQEDAEEKAATKEKETARGKAAAKKKAEAEKTEDEKKITDEAEALRQARLAMLNEISEDGLIKLAGDLGINYADCKDSADMLKRVKEALKK